ncbi:MAG: hypothetical protein ACU836_16895 [Gammaproteobacteria bacterium]
MQRFLRLIEIAEQAYQRGEDLAGFAAVNAAHGLTHRFPVDGRRILIRRHADAGKSAGRSRQWHPSMAAYRLPMISRPVAYFGIML